MEDSVGNGTESVGAQNAQTETSTNADWLNSFSPEYRDAVAKYGSIDGVAKSLMNAQGLLGKRTSEWKQSDAETYKAVMCTVDNIPLNAEDYNIQLRQADETGENCLTEAGVNIVKEVARQMGLNQEQGQQMYEVLNELELARNEEQFNTGVQNYQNCLDTLSRQWGNAAESKVQAMTNCVNNVLPKLYGVKSDEIIAELQACNAYSSPIIMNMLATFGELVSDGRSSGYAMSPMDAASRLEQFKADKETMNILMNRRDPRYAETRRQLEALIAQKNQV